MTTILKIGPTDHGRPLTNDELAACEFEGGYKYELIDGKIHVSYEPDPPENFIEGWLLLKIQLYSLAQPKVINYVTNKARVFVPGQHEETIPEPDLAAYRDYPLHLLLNRELAWEDVSPLLIGEVLSRGNPDKDLVRNVSLYLRVPTIREYWIVDAREDPRQPVLYVYRRRGSRWQRPIEIAPGDTYVTKLLPGFELILDPQRQIYP